jgi:8-oxo-dGTP pyrophosphatase MutT (NUDIX family)
MQPPNGHSRPRHTARALVIRGDNLLLMERWRDGLHYFSIPGGGIEPGETAEQTAVRELAEETGCVVRPARLLYILRLADQTEHSIFLADYVSGEPQLPADSPEALEGNSKNRFKPRWVPLDQLADKDFLVWAPVRDQLLHDLPYGLPETPRELLA